ncbi:heterokaryon incompatibility protein-domain-containing protein, partial [Bisporella sp. PMI_857]
WLSECTQNHTGCASVAEEPNLPTRVVDIGPVQESTQPRLLVTNGHTGAYLALSHCWGHKPLFATRPSNIEQLKDGIPVKKLLQTFIDIFRVARILRIRYVWIDSLYIIQDDDNDWAREAQNMGLIYENSYCTIAATSSNSGSMSFLKHWDKDLGCFGQKTDPLLNISQAPLNTRGWVLQERLLSRRVLHFATDQIYWECRSHAVAQDGTVFRPRGTVFMRSWLHIIEFYSACSFTYEKDRLPALLGLADRFSRFTKREYVCGHWFELGSKVIPNTLLWTACGQIRRRLTKQVAPSWSWAAAEGELTFENVN